MERRTKNLQRQFVMLHFIEADRSTKRRRRSLQVNTVHKCSRYDTMFTQYMKSYFPKRWWTPNLKKMSSSCHFAVYWTYSRLHQCFMPNRYISLFKMYLTLLTSQRGALATDAKSCSLWRSLLERPPPARGNPGSRPTRCDGADPGGFNNHCLTCSDWANRPF